MFCHKFIVIVAFVTFVSADNPPPPPPPKATTQPPPPPPKVTTQPPPPPTPAPCKCNGFWGTFCGSRYVKDSDFQYLVGDYVHPSGGCNPNAYYFCGRNDPYGLARLVSYCPQKDCIKNPYENGGHDDCVGF